MLHIFLAALVIACKRTEAIISIHHRLALRIDDAAGKTCRQRHREEGAVNSVAARQTEGNIRHAHNRVDATRLHRADNLAGNRRILCARGNRQCQRVNNDVAAFNAILRCARDNFIGHSNTSCRRRRNALIIKAQSYEYRAIFFRQRQHMRKAVLLAVDGVQHRLAVIQAQGTLHRLVIGGINLQRCIRNRLQSRYSLRNQRRLINARRADIHVQHLRPHANLLQTKAADIIKVIIYQSFLQALFACRIDTLADDNRPFAKVNCLAVGGHSRQTALARATRLQTLAFSNHLRDMLRRRAAAAADDACTLLRQLVHQLSIFLRPYIEAGLAVALHRQARVRVDNQGQADSLEHLRKQLAHLHRSQTAVEADSINAKTLAHQRRCLNSRTGQQLAVLVKGHGDADRQVAVLLSRQHSSLNLIGIAHRFDED